MGVSDVYVDDAGGVDDMDDVDDVGEVGCGCR
jgi:hypothetical protein